MNDKNDKPLILGPDGKPISVMAAGKKESPSPSDSEDELNSAMGVSPEDLDLSFDEELSAELRRKSDGHLFPENFLQQSILNQTHQPEVDEEYWKRRKRERFWDAIRTDDQVKALFYTVLVFALAAAFLESIREFLQYLTLFGALAAAGNFIYLYHSETDAEFFWGITAGVMCAGILAQGITGWLNVILLLVGILGTGVVTTVIWKRIPQERVLPRCVFAGLAIAMIGSAILLVGNPMNSKKPRSFIQRTYLLATAKKHIENGEYKEALELADKTKHQGNVRTILSLACSTLRKDIKELADERMYLELGELAKKNKSWLHSRLTSNEHYFDKEIPTTATNHFSKTLEAQSTKIMLKLAELQIPSEEKPSTQAGKTPSEALQEALSDL